MTEILTSQKLKDDALQAWRSDQDVWNRSEKTAEVLGAALIKVEKDLPYGAYGPWLRTSGISVNRASYCVRKANGKDASYKEKKKAEPHVVNLKAGTYIRWDKNLYTLESASRGEGLTLYAKPGGPTLNEVCTARAARSEPELVPPENGIVFNVLEMQACLDKLSGVVARRSQEIVYGNVLLSSDDFGIVRLLGIDFDTTLTVMVPNAKGFGPAVALCLAYKELKDVVKSLKTNEASLTLADGQAEITAGDFKCNLDASYPPQMVADLRVVQNIAEKPEFCGYTLSLPGLKEQIEQVAFAIPESSGTFVVPSVLLESTDEVLRLVAVDGFVMAISSVAANLGEFAFTLPKLLTDLLSKMSGQTVTIFETENNFYIETELELLTYPKTRQQFPPYQKVLPTIGTHKTQITVNSSAFLSALKRLRTNADPKEPAAIFSVFENGTNLSLYAQYVQKRTNGEAFKREGNDTVTADVTGPAAHFKLNIDRLLPFLERASGDICMFVLDHRHVIDMHAHGGTQELPVFRFLQLPMRLEDAVLTPAELATKQQAEAASSQTSETVSAAAA
jgi:DNA polymerase III sliding clamp (beta) subunit (PCNA family)